MVKSIMRRIDKIGAGFDAFMCRRWLEVCGALLIFALGCFLIVLVAD